MPIHGSAEQPRPEATAFQEASHRVTSHPLPDQQTGDPAPQWKRHALWLPGAIVVLLVLVLTPPLINANRYRGKIAESMSKSLGRPVHLDNVSLHLLPVPGFTLTNLVVSEDPAFGDEPTIRANTVEARLRVSSLWKHPVEFSTVRFQEPSVNLVRNAQGKWNLSDVLLNASHVQSAPTEQRRPGPKPRFPYIEATGGRVNIKIGPEKLPFSLTDADFALWLPSPQQWRVRLVGHPARTDRDITDPGRLRIEGELRHAGSTAEVPVDFEASWRNAPLGEATRLLTGEDWGWRGALNLDAQLRGKLGDARLDSKLTLGGLRRTEFFPTHPFDLQMTCTAGFAMHPATLQQVACGLPDDAPTPMSFHAATVHLQNLRADEVEVQAQQVPVRWALLWAGLFSPRVRADLATAGTLDVQLAHGKASQSPVSLMAVPERAGKSRHGRGAAKAAAATVPGGWTGALRLTLPPLRAGDGTGSPASILSWVL
ncbi:MAG: AsmA family protein, partial [Rhodospirillales bacterium]|nr:AsmA family protein [Acetobacter sp.]